MKVLSFSLLLLFCNLITLIAADGVDDKISGLPGTTFNVVFDQYSGYLNAGNNGTWKFFYWLVESQSGNAENDPLIVWFNGGPGCSSVGGLFEELGPFYVNKDGKTLYENVFAWNKYANILAIESPIGVGFSYSTSDPTNYTLGDDLTALQNHNALADFFNKVQPRYNNTRWFVAGESYAGIYIPTVTQNVFQSIVAGKFPNANFGGIAIGNGYMNIKSLTNALVLWTSYHGLIGLPQWRDLKYSCCASSPDVDGCDFATHLNYVYMNGSKDSCGNKVLAALNLDEDFSDPYNFYQDCYTQAQTKKTKDFIRKGLLRIQNEQTFAKTEGISNPSNTDQTADKIYYDSSDNQLGYPCNNGDLARAYLNQPEVMKAFHVDDAWIKNNLTWRGCNMPLNINYPVKYDDTTDIFKYIISVATDPKQYVKNFNILIYNGDVDTVCNFLGDSWHMENIANITGLTTLPRIPWVFRHQYAGYHQPYYTNYNNNQNNFTLDVLTVKGSGHFVPNDKQGPSLQMITNFIRGTSNYSSTNNFNDTPAPQGDPTASTTGATGSSILPGSNTAPQGDSTATTAGVTDSSASPVSSTTQTSSSIRVDLNVVVTIVSGLMMLFII